jgi:hypothetical protein
VNLATLREVAQLHLPSEIRKLTEVSETRQNLRAHARPRLSLRGLQEKALMPRHYKVVGFLLVLLLGIYGCAKTPGNAAVTDSAETLAKLRKLEDDYRAATVARDQYRQKLSQAEDQQTKTQNELEQTRAAATAERESLKSEVKARTTERDALQLQYESFRKNLKELLGSADASIGALNLPAPKPAADQGAQK